MRMETLVVTVDRTDHRLPEQMNIRTDAVLGNQCGRTATETTEHGGCRMLWVNTAERGVGRNRNQVLSHATAELCVLADDDMRFVDDYPRLAQRAFDACPRGDVLIFNLIEREPRRYRNRRIRRIHRWNYARYGAARLAVRRESLVRAGIRFDTDFGGGSRYGAGEDTIFLKDCLDRGLRLYAVPWALAEIDQQAPSTWFTGCNERFFADKGALYARLYPHLWPLQGLRFLLLRRKKYRGQLGFFPALRSLLRGGRAYLARREG